MPNSSNIGFQPLTKGSIKSQGLKCLKNKLCCEKKTQELEKSGQGVRSYSKLQRGVKCFKGNVGDCAGVQVKKKRIRKYISTNPENKKGHWTWEEEIKYHIFLECHFLEFIDTERRKTEKIFKTMSSFVQTRQCYQCRSHHQKVQKKWGTFGCILLNLRLSHFRSMSKEVVEEYIKNRYMFSGDLLRQDLLKDESALKQLIAGGKLRVDQRHLLNSKTLRLIEFVPQKNPTLGSMDTLKPQIGSQRVMLESDGLLRDYDQNDGKSSPSENERESIENVEGNGQEIQDECFSFENEREEDSWLRSFEHQSMNIDEERGVNVDEGESHLLAMREGNSVANNEAACGQCLFRSDRYEDKLPMQ